MRPDVRTLRKLVQRGRDDPDKQALADLVRGLGSMRDLTGRAERRKGSDPALSRLLLARTDTWRRRVCLGLEELRRHDETLDACASRFLLRDGPILETASKEDAMKPATSDHATRATEGDSHPMSIEWNRRLAPMSDEAWAHLEDEARHVLEIHRVARRLLDIEGPLGWSHSAIDLGRTEPLERESDTGARLLKRRVRPLIELRVPFEVDRSELENVDRGASDVDVDALHEAARRFAHAENSALFDGYEDADIPGLVTDSANAGVALPNDPLGYPDAIAEALSQLRRIGVKGPYAVAFGPDEHAALDRTRTAAGYPVLHHVERLVDRPIVWAPALRGGLVASLRGGDFRIVYGRDVTLGYLRHDDFCVSLYLESSFGFELTGPEATVPLLPSNL